MSGNNYTVPPRDRFTVNEEDLNDMMERYGQFKVNEANEQFNKWRWIGPGSIFVSVVLSLATKTDFRELPFGPQGSLFALTLLVCGLLALWTIWWLPIWSRVAVTTVTKFHLVEELRVRAREHDSQQSPPDTTTTNSAASPPAAPPSAPV